VIWRKGFGFPALTEAGRCLCDKTVCKQVMMGAEVRDQVGAEVFHTGTAAGSACAKEGRVLS